MKDITVTPKKKVEYSALDVAKYFIWKSHKAKKPITNKKLQKLLYYSQAWYLVLKNKPLFKDVIEAWIHGPAVPKVYGMYKKFGYQTINEEIKEQPIKEDELLSILNEIWDVYGKYDADYLESLTHNEEPWQLAREGLDTKENSSNIITLKSMKSYYSKRLNESKAKSYK